MTTNYTSCATRFLPELSVTSAHRPPLVRADISHSCERPRSIAIFTVTKNALCTRTGLTAGQPTGILELGPPATTRHPHTHTAVKCVPGHGCAFTLDPSSVQSLFLWLWVVRLFLTDLQEFFTCYGYRRTVAGPLTTYICCKYFFMNTVLSLNFIC